MTERPRKDLRRGPDWLAIGPSALHWDGEALVADIAEITAPLPSRIRGRIRVIPTALAGRTFTLDAAGRHRWTPVAPHARVEVSLTSPDIRWSGTGYFDSNAGDAPLERDFVEWDWSRAALRSGAAVLYDVARRDGTDLSLALMFDKYGRVEEFSPPLRVALPRTGWRMRRATRADGADCAKIVKTLEDAPFYTRSVLSTRLLGEDAAAMHESLSLDRERALPVRMMLPFRMPRALG